VDRSNTENDEAAQKSFQNNSLKALRCVEENQEMRSVFYHMGIVDYFKRLERQVACETILLSSKNKE